MIDTAAAQAPVEPLLETWAQALAQVLGQISGTAVPCALMAEHPAEMASAGENDLPLLAGFSGGLRGEMSLRLPPPTVGRFAQVLMGDAAPAVVEISAEQREAALELIRQVAGRVATSLAATWGDVQLRVEAPQGPPTWSESTTAWLRVGADGDAVWMELHLSAALAAALRVETSDEPAAHPAADETSVRDHGANVGLLMDVELAVSLRFGSKRLLLRDVLELGPGAVVELDRQVNEPVDLLLDGRLLARGEVVIMDGNYALRVTEVAPGL
jgi:flagellar motor switch protein FliN